MSIDQPNGAPAPRDRNGLEILNEAECLRLLASVPVARLCLAVNDVPIVLPVNFVIDQAEIVVRSAEGSKLRSALDRAIVAVEADEFDAAEQRGWSVIVKGRAREITGDAEAARARALPLRPWGIAHADHFLAVSMDLISGRRVVSHR